jgi:hypothetical protein
MVSAISVQEKASWPEISFAARRGSIIEVKQAIGKPSKIKKPIDWIFISFIFMILTGKLM